MYTTVAVHILAAAADRAQPSCCWDRAATANTPQPQRTRAHAHAHNIATGRDCVWLKQHYTATYWLIRGKYELQNPNRLVEFYLELDV